ncbi:MAG: DinB family protein [Bacteroidetes bacterium]|nr:DinB family protein [Bacteroidota bacterium]
MYNAATYSLYVLEKTRENFLHVIDSMTLDSLNTVYPGFNNTGAWNFCHAIVTSLLVTSGISGLDTGLSPRELVKFRKGSSGNVEVSLEELDGFLNLAKSSLEEMKEKYNAGSYSAFQPYETSFGAKLGTIEEALHFAGIHESLHLGYLMAIRRASAGNLELKQ